MKKYLLAALAVAFTASVASAADLAPRYHPRAHCASCHAVAPRVEAPLAIPYMAPAEPTLFAIPGVAVTTYPWLTQSYNPITNPVEFGLQFVPHVRLGVGSFGVYR